MMEGSPTQIGLHEMMESGLLLRCVLSALAMGMVFTPMVREASEGSSEEPVAVAMSRRSIGNWQVFEVWGTL